MGYRSDIHSWDRTGSIAEVQVQTDLQTKDIHALTHQEVIAVVTTADLYFDELTAQMLQGHKAVIVLLHGPHHRKDKFLDRDPIIKQILENPHYKLNQGNKVLEFEHEGGELSKSELAEIVGEIQKYVAPKKKQECKTCGECLYYNGRNFMCVNPQFTDKIPRKFDDAACRRGLTN